MIDSICNDCAKRTRCDMAEIGRSPLAISTCYCYEKGNPSNADRIRAMSDEELAEFMCHNVSNGTVNCAFCSAEEFCRMGHNGWLEWLKQEVTE